MACYHPLFMFKTDEVNKDTGRPVYKLAGKAFYQVSPTHPNYDHMYIVPCNRCIGCRLDYARDWTNRLLMEMADNPNALFITLTYDDEHVPISSRGYKSTSVRDCQLFLKRLRKRFADREIRYFLAAEYGPKTHRPHYHGIFFGLSTDDFPDLRFYKNNNLSQPLFISDFLANDIWKNGFCTIGCVNRNTCSYTARYMLKKAKGDEVKFYNERGIEGEFSLCSRNPGLGMRYFDHRVFSDQISIFVGNENVSFPVPTKVMAKYFKDDPELYSEIKAARRLSASVRESLELLNTDMDYLDYLDMKESNMYSRIKSISVETRNKL